MAPGVCPRKCQLACGPATGRKPVFIAKFRDFQGLRLYSQKHKLLQKFPENYKIQVTAVHASVDEVPHMKPVWKAATHCQSYRFPSHPSIIFRNNFTYLRRCQRRFVLPASSNGSHSDKGTETESNSGQSNSTSTGNSSGKAGSSSNQTGEAQQDKKQQNEDKPEPWSPWGWLQGLASAVSVVQPVRILLNLVLLFFLVRLWPLGSRSNLDSAQSVVVMVPFSEFMQQAKSNHVATVTVDGVSLSYTLRPNSPRGKTIELPEGAENLKITYSTVRPADLMTPYDTLLRNNVQFGAVDKRNHRLVSILMYALYIGLVLSFLNRFPLKLPQRGAARRFRGAAQSNTVTFKDVAGVDEAKEELAEVVEYLRAPERFARLGARPPSGILLCGPPGTGKTLLAKAIAGEADVPFFSISASEFVELYVGMGAMRVRELFASARKEAPAIVFIDEIDAVAKGRDNRLRSVGNDEREQTLNQLLTELDGFESDKDNAVICIAATNRADVLDPALLRPGRFDRRVAVERPDKLGREEILRVHLKRRGLPLAEDVTVEHIASATTGFTGADLANLVNEAALLAGRRNAADVSSIEFDNAILRSIAGVEKKRSILMGKEKSVVAKHEVGHAIVGSAVSQLLPEMPRVQRMSIVPRSGGSLGFTHYYQQEDRAMMFDAEIRAQLATLLGGRAAEQFYCGQLSTGAVDDIQRATSMAYKAVTEWGLSQAIGPVNISVLGSGSAEEVLLRDNSGKLAQLVDSEVKALIDAALEVAIEAVSSNRTIQEGLSAELEELEKVEGEKLSTWLDGTQAPQRLRDFVLHGKLPGSRYATTAGPASAQA
uniref:Cell division protease FtsH n=1 Tax=Tetraselmis sp. GSL018 TaxID=582737 RepID=A0A061R7E6_9CHLO